MKPRVYTFSTRVQWTEAKKGNLEADVKSRITIGCAPDFGGEPEYWSAQHLFIASIEVCIMTTFLWLAEKNRIAIVSYQSKAEGNAEISGKEFIFTEVIVYPVITTVDPGQEELAVKLLFEAADQCMISRSIKSLVKIKIPDAV